MDSKELYSVTDAATFLGGISPWTIYSWIYKRKIRRVKIGGRIMIRHAELLRMMVEDDDSQTI